MDADQLEAAAINSFLACGDKQSFHALFDIFYPRAIRFFRIRGADQQTSEDLAQNVFLAIFRSARQVREATRFRAWLFRIVRNEWLQHKRRLRAASRAVRAEPLSDYDDLADDSLSPHLACEMEELLHPLSESEREIVRLHFFDGLDYREIAELLNMAVGTIKWKVFQIRMKLAETIPAMTGRTS